MLPLGPPLGGHEIAGDVVFAFTKKHILIVEDKPIADIRDDILV